jgi:hypothetical protein
MSTALLPSDFVPAPWRDMSAITDAVAAAARECAWATYFGSAAKADRAARAMAGWHDVSTHAAAAWAADNERVTCDICNERFPRDEMYSLGGDRVIEGYAAECFPAECVLCHDKAMEDHR